MVRIFAANEDFLRAAVFLCKRFILTALSIEEKALFTFSGFGFSDAFFIITLSLALIFLFIILFRASWRIFLMACLSKGIVGHNIRILFNLQVIDILYPTLWSEDSFIEVPPFC